MTLKPVKWRRDLFPAERKVNFIALKDGWDTFESSLADALAPTFNQVLDKVKSDVEKIVKKGDIAALNDLKLGYKDKLVSQVKAAMADAYKFGKLQVSDEMKLKLAATVAAGSRDYFAVKAEAVVSAILDRVKSDVVFTALAGMNTGSTASEIVAEVLGVKDLIGKATASLAITNVAEAVNTGRDAGFEEIIDDLGAFQWSAILDERTCPICEELDGMYFRPGDPHLEELKPPIHRSCRCVLVGVLKEELQNYPVSFAQLTGAVVDGFTAGKLW